MIAILIYGMFQEISIVCCKVFGECIICFEELEEASSSS